MDIDKIRKKYLEIEEKIEKGEDFVKDLAYVLKEQANEIFDNKIDVKFDDGIYINDKKVDIHLLQTEYGEYWADLNIVILPNNPKAPTIFEETHHALQYAFMGYSIENKVIAEATVSYWRAKLFPEDREFKREITPRELDKEIIDRCDEIDQQDIVDVEARKKDLETILNKYGILIFNNED